MFGKYSKIISELALTAGLYLVLLMFLCVAIPSVLFIIGIEIHTWYAPLFLLIATFFFTLRLKKIKRISSTWRNVAAGVFIMLPCVAVGITSQLYDRSWDGNTYHKAAVGALANGWNPVYSSITSFNKYSDSEVKLANPYAIWNDHYAKGHWVFGANLYKLTGNIESSKSMLLISMIALFFISFGLLLRLFGIQESMLIALVLAFNPVALGQMFTLYSDAILGNLLIILILLLTTVVFTKSLNKNNLKEYLFFFFVVLVLLINIKFTGFVYAGAVCLIYCLYLIFQRGIKDKMLQYLVVTGITAVIFGGALVGLATYPKNTIQHGNPFFPLMGSSSKDIMSYNEPAGFKQKNRLEKFFISNFGESSNLSMPESTKEPLLKVPFSFTVDELSKFNTIDQRIAGFGVWFGGALMLSFIAFIYVGHKVYRKNIKQTYFIAGLLPLVSILVVVLMTGESWWARYVPHMILVPVIAIIWLLILNRKSMAYTLLFVLLVNAVLMSGTVYGLQRKYDTHMDKTFGQLDCSRMRGVYTPNFDGFIYNIYDKCGESVVYDRLPSGSKLRKKSIRKGVLVLMEYDDKAR